MLTSCLHNGSHTKTGGRLPEDAEHHIKDTPNTTKHDSTILYTGWYYTVDTDNGFKRQLE
jgi:hypothetical protein